MTIDHYRLWWELTSFLLNYAQVQSFSLRVELQVFEVIIWASALNVYLSRRVELRLHAFLQFKLSLRQNIRFQLHQFLLTTLDILLSPLNPTCNLRCLFVFHRGRDAFFYVLLERRTLSQFSLCG